MNPGIYNITIYQGSTWNYDFIVVTDSNSDLVDFTNKSFRMQIREDYSTASIIDLTTANSKLIQTNGADKGTWVISTAYVTNDIVLYGTTYYICDTGNTGELPTNTSYWSVYKQLLFNLSSTDTEGLTANDYLYDLEVVDATVTPNIIDKILKGTFRINAEVTK